MKSTKNKYLFFILRIWKDITRPTIWEIGSNLHSQKLREYYFIFKESLLVNQKGGQKSIIYDSDGIPMNPTYIDVKDKKFVYFPITIGQVGLAVFSTYLETHSEQDKKRFMKFPDWFIDNVTYDKKLGAIWLTNVSLPQYKNPGPWQSAFVQGRAISNLLRGYQLSGDNKYAALAEKALIPFKYAVPEGGVTSFTEWGPFYEEYTSKVPTLVLNGMVFSLCGLYDFVRVFPENELAQKLYKQGIKTIKHILPEFDLKYWSRYNLCVADFYPKVDPSTITYQHLHITQLKMLHLLTGEQIFNDYALKFKKQLSWVNIIRMYLVKYKALKTIGRL